MDGKDLFMTWIRGEVQVVLMLVITAVFGFLGLTLSLQGLTNPSGMGLLSMLLAFAMLPFIYGYINSFLGDLLMGQDEPSWMYKWIQGLLLVILIIVITTVFAFFGLTLTFAVAQIADVVGLLTVIIAFVVLPLAYGYVGHWLSETIS